MKTAIPAPRPIPYGRSGALRLGLPIARGMRVGLLGGSFDPPHRGHLHVAETARRRLGLDKVIWLVSPGNPLKAARPPAPLQERLAAVRRLAAGRAMAASDAEHRLGARYTIDTVRLLKGRYPGVRFVWIMGADNLDAFTAWRDWPGLMREIPVAIVARPGNAPRRLLAAAPRRFGYARRPASAARRLVLQDPPAWVYLAAPWDFSSSTALRAQARRVQRA
jgi:nicotinate-nucleotide adenylyltransferase